MSLLQNTLTKTRKNKMLDKRKTISFIYSCFSTFLFVACEHNTHLIEEKCKNYVGVKECECLENELSSKRGKINLNYQIQSLLQNSIIICYQKVNKK